MSSLSTMTVAQLAELSNAPVVHPTGQRKSKLTAVARMASMLELEEALVARGLKKKAERKSKNPASAKNTPSRVTRKNFTFRRLVTNTMIQKNGWPSNEGTRGGTRGKNGHFLRVAIHKETRKVSKVNEKNWTMEGNKLYKALYPNNVDYKKTLTPVEKTARKAKKAFDKEMARRAKAEEEWAAKYGRSFRDFQNYLTEARTDVDDDEEDILSDGLVC
tara:strand:- start:6875 stop:7528 length:654 start_codon:yes stop_codon:yes gene_type:complete